MNLKDSVQLEFGSVIGLLKREMESGPITNLYLNLIRSKQLARECKQTACEPSLSSIFGPGLLLGKVLNTSYRQLVAHFLLEMKQTLRQDLLTMRTYPNLQTSSRRSRRWL